MGAGSSADTLSELGVGVTYMSALAPLLRSGAGLIDVVEVEPQTLWLEGHGAEPRYRMLDGVFETIAALPYRKLVHSVGAPVGGTVRPHPQAVTLLAENVSMLGSPWLSEHLSFNATPAFHTGFFLPPRQTRAGVANAIAAVRAIRSGCGVPIAVETGVNYLKPRDDEIPDGRFVAEVAQGADCGILLDLHNLYCNQRNGRQSIETFLGEIPLERVWEVHLAGGLELDGYWLDAHSGAIPAALVDACRAIFPRLPNLKAVIFEIFPSFVEEVGLDTVARQIEVLRELWQLRGASGVAPPQAPVSVATPDGPDAGTWEMALGSAVIGRSAECAFAAELKADAGVRLVRGLIREFRGSTIVSVLRLTSRLLMLAVGTEVFTAILRDFWSKHPPRQFAASEAEAFANYLTALDLQVPHLAKVLEFERAAVDSLTHDTRHVVAFDFDPIPLLRALAEGRLPEMAGAQGRFEITLTSATPTASTGLDLDAVRGAYPFH
jgi:uncharacterized protein